jgi:CubicO group peptidase (beta-lactamase class C family)
MTDFRGERYGLGTVDLAEDYGVPGAVGHGGMEDSHATVLVAFPDDGIVVAVQANADHLDDLKGLVAALYRAARPAD